MAKEDIKEDIKDQDVENSFNIPFQFNKGKADEKYMLPDMQQNKDGVIEFGDDNLFPDWLKEMRHNKGSKHTAIINRKVKMIAGSGFEKNDALNEFFENKNGNMPLSKMVKLNADDFETHNYFTNGVRFSTTMEGFVMDYEPAHKFRLDKDEKYIWKCNDWNDTSNNEPVKLLRWNPADGIPELPDGFDQMDESEQKTFMNRIVWTADLQTGTDTYPLPPYNGGIDWIIADGGIAVFTRNLIRKKFTGDYHIDFANGVPGPDERKQTKKDFIKEYSGHEGDTIIVTFSHPDGRSPELKPLPSSGNEDIYNETEKRAQENILIAHEVTNPSLFGIAISGELGGRSRMLEDLEIFQAVYIDDRQNIIEETFGACAKAKKLTEQVKLNQYSIVNIDTGKEDDDQFGKTAEALAKLSPLVATKVLEAMTENEIRRLGALGPKEEQEPQPNNEPIIE